MPIGLERYVEGFYHWGPLSIISAILITVISSLLKLRNFDKPFKIFVIIASVSIFMATMRIPLSPIPFFQAAAVTSVTLSIALYITRRQTSYLLFLLSTVCFIVAGMVTTRNLGVEFSVFSYILAFAFVGLVFQVTSDMKDSTQGSLSSFFALEKKLEETQIELEISQEQLLKAQRLATIGELAAWVGHDLRNPLTGIAGAVFYLRRYKTKLDKKGVEMLDTIENAIEHSNKIITDLLDYSKEIHLELVVTSLRKIVEESCLLFNFPDNIHVLNLIEDEIEIEVDEEKIKRAILNLMRNSVDAMEPNGGKLSINGWIIKNNLRLSITDTGAGIPEEIIEKIWNPLFTTKAKGMGFGLPICKRVVEAHNGSISVVSKVGEGSTFTVTLPITSDPKTEPANN